METKIAPKDFNKTASKVEITIGQFPLYEKKGTAIVVFKSENGEELRRERVEIPEVVFSKWGTDDSVIEKHVFDALDLKKSK